MDNLPIADSASVHGDQSAAVLVGTITYTCPSCREYTHKWPSRIRKHLTRCERPRLCVCPRCKKPFASRGQLRCHLREDCSISTPTCAAEPSPKAFPSCLYDGPVMVTDEQVVRPDSTSLTFTPITPGRLDCASVVGLGGLLYCCTVCGSVFGQYPPALVHQRSCC